MTTHSIKTIQSGALYTIILNRPKALNALNLEMLQDLKSALLEAFADDRVKSIWLESDCEKAFCAGGDVKALIQTVVEVDLPAQQSAIGRTYFELEYGIDSLIEHSPKPIVAFADGLVYGGGWGLFAGANLRLCSAKASFAMPEVQIGFYPDVGAAHFLQKPDWKVGTFLGLSGITLTAQEAVALDYADGIAATDYAAVLKKQLSAGIEVTELAIDVIEPDIRVSYQAWVDAMEILPDDAALTDWISLAEQNSQLSPFRRAIQAWKSASSWSVAFTWAYFRHCRNEDRQMVLDADTRAASFFCAHPEFQEGVHAKLIDKDRVAKWQYPHVESVPLQDVLAAIE